MELVVLDTSQSVPGLLASGRARSLLALLAYGRLAHRVEEIRELADAADGLGAGVHPPIEEQLEAVQHALARVEERLEIIAPRDYAAAMSLPMIGELTRTLRDGSFGKAGFLTAHEVFACRLQMMTTCATIVPAFDADSIPRYVDGDRDDDVVVETALRAGARYIISRDKHLCQDWNGVTDYRDPTDPEAIVQAMRLDVFANDVLPSFFRLDMVHPDLFRIILENLPIAPSTRAS